jgi:hypothetical protein
VAPGCARWSARVAALVQEIHLVQGGRAEHLVLRPVEGRRHPREFVGARVQPVGAREAHPLALRHGPRPRHPLGEPGRDRPEVAGEHREHAQLAHPVGDPAAEGGPRVEELPGDGGGEAGQVLQQPPRLMGRARHPRPQLLLRVSELLEHPVVQRVRARVDEDLVVAVQGQHVQLALPVRPVEVGARVAVVGVVEREAVGDVGPAGDRPVETGQLARQEVRLLARPVDLGVRDVPQVPVEAGELGGGGVTGHRDAPGAPRHAEGVVLPPLREGDLPPVVRQQPPGRRRGRAQRPVGTGCVVGGDRAGRGTGHRGTGGEGGEQGTTGERHGVSGVRWGYAVAGIPAGTALVRRHAATRGRNRHERLLP